MREWASPFLLNPFVNRVKWRICIRILGFWRSTYGVKRCFASGHLCTRSFLIQVYSVGL